MCAAGAIPVSTAGHARAVCEAPYAGTAPSPGRRAGAYDGRMVKVVGVISPVEKREIRAEAEDYEAAHEALKAQVPDGWRLLSILVER